MSAKKEKATGVSDAERNAKAREMNKGSLSILIVALESRETIPREPVSSEGGYRGVESLSDRRYETRDQAKRVNQKTVDRVGGGWRNGFWRGMKAPRI